MFPALCVIVAQKLKQQTTSSCVARFFAEKRQKPLNSLFKIDVSFKNLNDEMLSDILLFGSDKYKDTVIKEILVHTNNFLKTTKRFERPLFSWSLIPLYDQLFNFSSSFTLFYKHDVVTLLAPYQLLQICIISPLLNNDSQVFVGSKHTFMQHLTISVLSEVSTGWRIAQRFNICNFVLVLFVTRFVSCTG